MIFAIKVKAILNTKLPRPEVSRKRRVFFFLKFQKFAWLARIFVRIFNHLSSGSNWIIQTQKLLEKKSILYVTLEKRMMIPFPLLRDKSYPHLSFERLSLLLLHSHRLLDEQKKFLSLPLGLIWTTWKLSLFSSSETWVYKRTSSKVKEL